MGEAGKEAETIYEEQVNCLCTSMDNVSVH
jgi:hypothetical protein